MSNVYLTLVSDVTSDYNSNVANLFKVKSKLRLHGEGWKVSIVSAILPKMALFKDLQNETKNLIEIWYDLHGVDRRNWYFNGTDLKRLQKNNKCKTEVDFMNEVKNLLDERRRVGIQAGSKITDVQWVDFEWKREQSEPELFLHHSDPSTSIMILKKFADIMQWSDKDNTQLCRGVEFSDRLPIQYPRKNIRSG